MSKNMRHGTSTWCNITIWIDERRDGWYAEIRQTSGPAVARTGPFPSHNAAQDQLCTFLTRLVNEAKSYGG